MGVNFAPYATTPISSFAENAFVGRWLQIGTKAVIAVTDRDLWCKMITLDPSTAEARPEILRVVRDATRAKRASMVPCSSKELSDWWTKSGCWTSGGLATQAVRQPARKAEPGPELTEAKKVFR
jgi:hypothetical protein